jgi:2,4-dienoyl-CoA reductase-like NADH-dependent reductase (Old Yellow Enzyme family)
MFKPSQIGRLQLEHKVVLAPLTRMRAPKEADGVFYPGDLNVEYYSQRASKGGFMLSEACPISRLVSHWMSSRNRTELMKNRLQDTLAYQVSSHRSRSMAGSV